MGFVDEVVVQFFEKLYQFILPPTVYKSSLFFKSLPALAMCCLFDDSHSNKCEVVPHCGFDTLIILRLTLVGSDHDKNFWRK